VDALTSPKGTATAMATSLTPWASVVGLVQPMRMPMAFATTWTNAWARLMLVASATDQVTSTSVDALTSQKEIAIAMATSLTP
jgi:hypothetical protein